VPCNQLEGRQDKGELTIEAIYTVVTTTPGVNSAGRRNDDISLSKLGICIGDDKSSIIVWAYLRALAYTVHCCREENQRRFTILQPYLEKSLSMIPTKT